MFLFLLCGEQVLEQKLQKNIPISTQLQGIFTISLYTDVFISTHLNSSPTNFNPHPPLCPIQHLSEVFTFTQEFDCQLSVSRMGSVHRYQYGCETRPGSPGNVKAAATRDY